MKVLTDNYQYSQAATLNENRWPFCENDRPFWREYAPLMNTLHIKLVTLKDTLNPTNPLMEAVNYALNHWLALTRCLDDPDFDIDNNTSEQAIKSFVLMRNYAESAIMLS